MAKMTSVVWKKDGLAFDTISKNGFHFSLRIYEIPFKM
jgi:hypothetical protein